MREARCRSTSCAPCTLQECPLTLPAATADPALLTLRKIYGTVLGFVVLPIDPFAATVKYTMPTCKTRERSKRLYTLDVAKDILERLHGTSLEAPFIMACFGSYRSGESLGIRTDEVMPFATESTTLATVDLVRQTEQAGIEPTADGVLKTRKSIRTVVVLPDAVGRLLEIADERRAAGSE